MSNRKSKYGNKKIEINGLLFDSKKEGYYYLYLLDRLRKGEIMSLRRQVEYELVPGIYETRIIPHKRIPDEEKVVCLQEPICYVADFVYADCDSGLTEVVDVKSDATRKDQVYILKKKMMRALKGIVIKEA